MSQLVVSKFIRRPWEHLCKALKKSNQHANKDFQSRTRRADEDYITKTHCSSKKMFFSPFCKFIKSGKCTRSFLNNAGDVLGGTHHIPSYLHKCQKSLDFLKVAVGEKRPSSLLLYGLRFHVLGTFGCTASTVA